MFIFPLCNLIFLIILYGVHKKVFIVTAILEVLLNTIGIYYIYMHFDRADNRTLYLFALTGFGFILALTAFFVAITLNHKHLYNNTHE